jgi:hypothetical protein
MSASSRQICLVCLALLIGFCLPGMPPLALYALLFVTVSFLLLFYRSRQRDNLKVHRAQRNLCIRCGVPQGTPAPDRCPACDYEASDEM